VKTDHFGEITDMVNGAVMVALGNLAPYKSRCTQPN
jgi:hypothetical protein